MSSFVVPLFTSGRSGNNKETTRDSTRAISRRRSIWWDLLHCEKFTSSFDCALYHFFRMGDIQGPCDSTRCQGRMEHFEAKSSGKLEYEKWWRVLKMIQECGTKRWEVWIDDCLVSVSWFPWLDSLQPTEKTSKECIWHRLYIAATVTIPRLLNVLSIVGTGIPKSLLRIAHNDL